VPIRLLLSVVLGIAVSSLAHAQVERGKAPPDLLGVDKDKKEVRVSEFHGKVVVLTFWASWCGYCLKELPILENVQRHAGSDRVAVVAINSDKDRSDFLAMRRRMKDYQMIITEDSRDRAIAAEYGVSGYPHMVMVDKQGLVAFTHRGYSEKMLPKLVDEINGLMEEDEPAPANAAH
jgi:thiol-disulfide isomerase/thioredoxin